jgi:hypothetical protein
LQHPQEVGWNIVEERKFVPFQIQDEVEEVKAPQ